MEVADYSPTSRTREENLRRSALLGEPEVPGELEPPVRVQLDALRELRLSQAALAGYVRASFASQQRLTDSFKVLSWLSESKTLPEKLQSDDYWLRGKESLDRIEMLSVFLTDLRLDEPEFADWGPTFDEALKTSRALAGGMRNPVREGDPRATADDLEQTVRSMNAISTKILGLCEHEAKRVIETMREGLTRIFDRIETERETLERVEQEQQQHIDPSGFVEIKKPHDDISQTEQPPVQPRAGDREADAANRESQAKVGQSQAEPQSPGPYF